MTTDRDFYRGFHQGVCQAIDFVWDNSSEEERIKLKAFEESIQSRREAVCRGEAVF